MGQVLTIEGDAYALATKLAALTGESPEHAVAEAIRVQIAAAQAEQAARERAVDAVKAFHDLLAHPRPGSDHSWLYDDETGLPI